MTQCACLLNVSGEPVIIFRVFPQNKNHFPWAAIGDVDCFHFYHKLDSTHKLGSSMKDRWLVARKSFNDKKYRLENMKTAGHLLLGYTFVSGHQTGSQLF